MGYLKLGMMKILSSIPIWNLVYPILFGYFIINPLYLFIISTVITIHILYLSNSVYDDDGDTPIFTLLSFIGLPIVIYIMLSKTNCVKLFLHKILVKMGKRIPDNWDNEKL
jgi:hypothetical protein